MTYKDKSTVCLMIVAIYFIGSMGAPVCAQFFGSNGFNSTDIYFEIMASWDQDQEFRSHINRPDGSIIAVGYSSGISTIKGILLKYDAYGNLVWVKSCGLFINDIQETDDGGYVIVGTQGSIPSVNFDSFIARFNADDSLEWARRIEVNDHDGAESIAVCHDGGFIVGGYSNVAGLLFTRFDSQGDFLWSRSINGIGLVGCEDILPLDDGGFYATGYMWNDWSGGQRQTDAVTVKFDSSGELLWLRSIGYFAYDYGRSICDASDDGVIISGCIRDLGPGNSDGLLVKYSSAGVLQWAYAIGSPTWEEFTTIFPLDDGGYILGGANGLLLKVDQNFNENWANQINTLDGWVAILSSDETPEGDITWTGGVLKDNSTESLLAKTDSNGLITDCPYSGPYPELISKIDIMNTAEIASPALPIENHNFQVSDITDTLVVPMPVPTLHQLCLSGSMPTPTPVPPTPTATPVPGSTPTPVNGLRVIIDCPESPLHAGDEFYLDIVIENNNSTHFTQIPLFCLIDVAGMFFYYPTWTIDPAWEILNSINPGNTRLPILPLFQWPDNVGSGSAVIWGVLTDPQMNEILGEFDRFTLSWE